MSFEVLHQVRSTLDRKRQPSRSGGLDDLARVLDGFHQPHPYALHGEQRRALGGTFLGPAAAVGRRSFLYRLNGLASLLRRREGLQRLDLRPEEVIFQSLLQERRTRLRDDPGLDSWQPLSRLVEGSLKGARGVDFWTDLEIPAEGVRRTAYRLGLPRDYHPADPLILRARVAEIRVPTVLDGFDHPAFYAVAEAGAPRAGRTLDLRDPKAPRPGPPEYVTGEIPVDAVEFQPIEWVTARDPAWRLLESPGLVEVLAEFFRRELERE